MDRAIAASTIFIPDNFLLVEAEKKLMQNAIWFLRKWSGFDLGAPHNDNARAVNENERVEA